MINLGDFPLVLEEKQTDALISQGGAKRSGKDEIPNRSFSFNQDKRDLRRTV